MSAQFRVARTAVALLAVVVTATLAMAPVRADTEKELKQAEARLDELIGQIDAQQAEVSRLQGEASLVAAEIAKIQGRIVATQTKIVQKQEQLREAEVELQATQDQLDRRAWVAYENGPGTSLEFLLGATSLSDLTTRLEIVDRAAESDRGLIDQLEALEERLRRRAAELQDLMKVQRGDRKLSLAQQEELMAQIAAGQAVVDSLNSDKAEADGLVAKLEDQLAAERLAAALAMRGGGIGGFLLRCPVNGFVSYSDDFGAPRIGHLHAGNDMFAVEGTPIVAPFTGTAEDASGGLGGYAVKVFGDQGWVYNAHLTDPPHNLGSVTLGEVIGYVGKTGNAQGTSPHDHFEWHPNVIPDNLHVSPYGVSQLGSAIDPYPYLNAVC
jgi:peptidoglycan hydrolase CwlO-like protein